MKIFIDTANIEEIEEVAAWGVLRGVTTNPSLIAKEEGDYHSLLAGICSLVDGPISAEVLSLETEAMVTEAEELAAIHPNIVIKIPLTAAGLAAIKKLAEKGIKTNATLIFSVNQALLAMSAGANYISPFIGRLDDISEDGMELIHDLVTLIEAHGLDCEIIAASIRHPQHVLTAALAGAHIATIPYGIIKKMIEHPLTEQGIDKFISDWQQRKNQV